ncbi:hypothetical protein ACFFP0_29000 [Rhizobium puerariae]|uniref:Uncharacterized protein n=1 Tax=Rhizobium puerariae TaxID=1585791 RepID=A0ABV6AQK4_9HYPH
MIKHATDALKAIGNGAEPVKLRPRGPETGGNAHLHHPASVRPLKPLPTAAAFPEPVGLRFARNNLSLSSSTVDGGGILAETSTDIDTFSI